MKLALDLNSFFASCEQQERPELRGKPVGVAPLLAETTCCIAASHAAKKFGVKTGTQVAEARRLCPGIVIVEARPPLYVAYHERIKACVEKLAPIELVPSIDEVICELPAYAKSIEGAKKLALEIKAAMRRELGECMTCSIGLAPNHYLAKTASDMQKPDGLVVIEPGDLPQILWGLELRDLCGIGPSMEARLRAAGIDTVRQLTEASRLQLRKVWGGVEGEWFYDKLRGLDVPMQTQQRASVGHSHVLPPDKRNEVDARAILHRMMQKAAMRLRRLGLVTGQMQASIRYIGRAQSAGKSGYSRPHWGTAARFTATDDTLILSHYLDQLWAQRPATPKGLNILHVGVTFTELLEARHQTIPLLPEEQPHTQLMDAMDKLNLRFGKNTLYFGAAHKGRDHAPMRIAFSRIPDVEVE